MRRTVLLSLVPALALSGAVCAQERVGECGFDPATLAFAGTPTQQATCLMRRVEWRGEKAAQALPAVFERLLESPGAPSPGQRSVALAAFPEPYQAYARTYAGRPAAVTEAGLPAAYFVIHDTSMPFLDERPFPHHLDRDWEVNAFEPYVVDRPVAHIFLNRAGQIWAGHDFSEGWRATKLESWVIGSAARGRFIHIEVVQPRRFAPKSTSLADTVAPEPGFSTAQYRMLAALYVYASARAGRWLIPAQHATVDAGIPDAHDDPQHFELERFAAELEALLSIDEAGP